MAASTWANTAPNTPHQLTKVYWDIGTTPTFIKQIWVKVAGVYQLVFAALQPFTEDFTIPGSFSPTVPFGAVQLTMAVTGGGGSGGNGIYGGSAAGTAQRTVVITQADWGSAISLTVGAGGAAVAFNVPSGNNGTTSTLAVTLNAGAFNLSGNHGNFGVFSGAIGGTASGGSTNTSGGNGSSSAGNGGASVWATGGALGSPNGGAGSLGSGGGGTFGSGNTGAGGNGRVKLDWS